MIEGQKGGAMRMQPDKRRVQHISAYAATQKGGLPSLGEEAVNWGGQTEKASLRRRSGL